MFSNKNINNTSNATSNTESTIDSNVDSNVHAVNDSASAPQQVTLTAVNTQASRTQDAHNLSNASAQIVPSIKRRLACWVYEGVLLFGVVFIAGYLFSTLSQTRNALDNRHALQAFIFLVFGAYFTYLWRRGQTLAMKTWKLRITNAEGLQITQRQALLRYLLCWLWFIPPLAFSRLMDLHGMSPFGLMIAWIMVWAWSSRFNSTQQFWQDHWAQTKIVQIA